jgi:hypothetical protein
VDTKICNTLYKCWSSASPVTTSQEHILYSTLHNIEYSCILLFCSCPVVYHPILLIKSYVILNLCYSNNCEETSLFINFVNLRLLYSLVGITGCQFYLSSAGGCWVFVVGDLLSCFRTGVLIFRF